MRDPIQYCTTLRDDLDETSRPRYIDYHQATSNNKDSTIQKRSSPAKSGDMNRSMNEDQSFQRLIHKTDQNDDSMLVFDHLAKHRMKYAEARTRI